MFDYVGPFLELIYHLNTLKRIVLSKSFVHIYTQCSINNNSKKNKHNIN